MGPSGYYLTFPQVELLLSATFRKVMVMNTVSSSEVQPRDNTASADQVLSLSHPRHKSQERPSTIFKYENPSSIDFSFGESPLAT